MRCTAVSRLTNQAVLADIAKNDKDKYVRKEAVEKITDQALLAEIANNDENGDVRIAASIRDHNHDWNGCKCKICGFKRDSDHRFIKCKCHYCGKVQHEGDKVYSGNRGACDWYICKTCGKEYTTSPHFSQILLRNCADGYGYKKGDRGYRRRTVSTMEVSDRA